MKTKIIALWIVACGIGMGRPGALDRSFDPELRAFVTPDHFTIAPDGRAWIGGGFDRGDGYSTGDLVRLGENGGVESEPAWGYLKRVPSYVTIGPQTWSSQSPALARPFLLQSGEFLLKGESGGWLRMSANGVPRGKAFPDRSAGEIITPQFELGGKLWVIRQSAGGERNLERRNSADGTRDLSLSQAPSLPKNINAAVPAPEGRVWVLAGDGIPWAFDFGGSNTAPEQKLFLVGADGNPIGEPRVIKGYRPVDLVAGQAGAFRLIYGSDQSRWWYWPSPSFSGQRIEWYSATGILLRTQGFSSGLYETLVWAEAADGSYVVQCTGFVAAGTYYAAGGGLSQLRRFNSAGVADSSFISPGNVRAVQALADGKWLLDGTRRINPNGTDDTTWTAPILSRPAIVKTLLPLPGRKVLVGGDFATIDGFVRNRLAVFDRRGAVDPSFILDERIEEVQSVAATAQAIYIVTSTPVVYADGSQWNLVKLHSDGTVDESFKPQLRDYITSLISISLGGIVTPISFPPVVAPFQRFTTASQVIALSGGDLLVATSHRSGDFYTGRIFCIRGDGSVVTNFKEPENFHTFSGTLPLKNGGFVSGKFIYRADGSVAREIVLPDSWLTPLCECQAGVLFRVSGTSPLQGLALWSGSGFARWFRAPSQDANSIISATVGDFGMIYLTTLLKGQTSIQRLFPNGRPDPTFRPPLFESRERQFGSYWWKAEENGKAPFNPALPRETDLAFRSWSYSSSILWQSSSRHLWIGGDFNMVSGQPRDGLARIDGTFSWWPFW